MLIWQFSLNRLIAWSSKLLPVWIGYQNLVACFNYLFLQRHFFYSPPNTHLLTS
uniref:Uncharacterized protein n=1 Tax=Arundo donax TaxID=35708 RepID=A0A0A9BY58_ARUDO